VTCECPGWFCERLLGGIPEVYFLQRCPSGTSLGEATCVLILVAAWHWPVDAVGTDLVSIELLPISHPHRKSELILPSGITAGWPLIPQIPDVTDSHL
jgi:hypothetical protein